MIYLFFILISSCIIQTRLLNKQKKRINVVFAINNKYIDNIISCLFSLYEHSDKNSIYDIYVQVNDKFESKNIRLIYELEKKFFNCFIHIINMGEEYKRNIAGSIDTSTYYRLKLPVLLPKERRIIHIDTDSTILKDLIELYTLNFNQNYILGRLDLIVNELDALGIYTKTYINCGVLLMDLYSLRKYNYVDKFLEYIKIHNNYRYLNHHDQTLINYVCHDKIGILRPKFHMWPFNDEKEVLSTNKKFRIRYDEKEFIKDYNDPVIIHYPGYNKNKIKFKSIYNDEYYKYSRIAEERKNNLKFGFFKTIIDYIKHFFQKILFF